MERIYIQEGDNERYGLTSDISEHIGSDNQIICTIGEGNIFRVNEKIRIDNVRVIDCGKNYTTFKCWKQGGPENSSLVELPTEIVKSIRCAGHYHSEIYKADMSRY